MAIVYPTTLDALNDPGSGDSLNTAGVVHHVQHGDANDAIEALEAKVGVNASAVVTSLDFGLTRNRALTRIVAPVAIANTETVVLNASMVAGFMVVGTSFLLKAYGRLTSGATAGSSIFRVRIGTTTLTGNIAATLTIANAALKTNAPFVVTSLVTVRTAGGGGTVIGNMDTTGGLTTVPFTLTGDVSATSSTVAVDTTATKLIEFTYISGNAGTTATFENVILEALTV